jgi:ABC-2 type transport system permease protein
VTLRVMLRHHARLHRVALVPLALGLALFEWLMTFVAGEPMVSRFLSEALRAAPPQFLALLNQDLLVGVSARGIVGVGYAHPFSLIMMAVWSVRVPCGALAGEIGRGTMDLMAARPVSRSSQVAAAALALFAGLGVLAASAWLGTAVGLVMRPLPEVSAFRYLPVAAALWLVFGCFGAVALLVSSLASDAGTAIAWIAGLLAGSYVLDYVARVWTRLASLRPASLFSYYEPQRVVEAGLGRHDAAVLAAVGAAALALAFAVFGRRDL